MPQALNPKLVERAVRGDQAALCQLLQTSQHRLYNVVLRMIGHRDDAAEVTQDTLLKIIEHIGDFKGKSDITTWMTRIAMNAAFSHLRKQRLRRTVSLDHAATDPIGRVGRDQLSPLRDQLTDPREPNPAIRVQQEEQQQQLTAALARLQDDLRAIIVLRDIDQMEYQQIAEVMGIPIGTVKSRLFRARLALRREILQKKPPPQNTQNRPKQAVSTPDTPSTSIRRLSNG